MARYKTIDTHPRFLAVDLARQLLPGTFEHALSHLLDHEIDVSAFDARFCNDTTGAPAYPPATLLKVVLFAYAQGIVSSRGIERACEEHVTFIALCGARTPHCTTIAHVVSTLGPEIARIFAAVVAICDAEGLIGREMFAIDGVKRPSNASKQRSGTRAEFERQAAKLDAAATTMLTRHRAHDALPIEPDLAVKAVQRLARLHQDAAPLRDWLATHPDDRRGTKGAVRKSHRTDNERAKRATGKGVMQGDTGVAAVDRAYQIMVEAQAHGTGAEQELLLPVVTAWPPLLAAHSIVTADAGDHSEANVQQLAARPVTALIADNDLRRRDARFATQAEHHTTPDPLYDKSREEESPTRFQPGDFDYDPVARTCTCPAGKSLYRKGQSLLTNGFVSEQFRGTKRDCLPCPLRTRCLRDPAQATPRQVAFFRGRVTTAPPTHSARMKQRIDAPAGRAQYGQRFAIVEPVFANLRHNKRLDRFTLRGRTKVEAQWRLFCLVHHIEKLAHHGYAA